MLVSVEVANPNTSNTPLRPAQVLLTEADRQLQQRLNERITASRGGVAGPTLLHRAGLLALSNLGDEKLMEIIDTAARRPSLEDIKLDFQTWCNRIGAEVGRRNPALEYAHTESQPGYFSNQGRFVSVSAMSDGRCLISGLQAVPTSVKPGERIPRAPMLFPGGLATLVSLDDEGARLAADAVEVWLSFADERLAEVRAAFGRHHPQGLR